MHERVSLGPHCAYFRMQTLKPQVAKALQWTPLLLVVSMFACKNKRSVALGLTRNKFQLNIIVIADGL